MYFLVFYLSGVLVISFCFGCSELEVFVYFF